MATAPIDRTRLINQKSLRDLARLLVIDGNLHEGFFDLSFELQTVIGAFGPNPDEVLPGAIFGIKSVGLMPSVEQNPMSVNAAEVNPQPLSKSTPIRRKAQSKL